MPLDEGTQFTGIIRDLTEQKAAQQNIIEQQQRLAHTGRLSTMGEMTASIAHEINQPLTAISMYAQSCIRLLKKDNFDQAKLMATGRMAGNMYCRTNDRFEMVRPVYDDAKGEAVQR